MIRNEWFSYMKSAKNKTADLISTHYSNSVVVYADLGLIVPSPAGMFTSWTLQTCSMNFLLF